MTRESVRLTFLIAGLNDLNICDCNIGNAYINAPCLGLLWTKSGSESGSEKGYVFLLVRALYGMKSSGEASRANPAEILNSVYYRSTESEPDVWIERATIENCTAY